MSLRDKLMNVGFELSISQKHHRMRWKEKDRQLQIFTDAVKAELKEEGPMLRSDIVGDALEFLLNGSQDETNRNYLTAKLKNYFLPNLDKHNLEIKWILLSDGIKKYLVKDFHHIIVDGNRHHPRDYIHYLTEKSLEEFFKKAYKGLETEVYVKLDLYRD